MKQTCLIFSLLLLLQSGFAQTSYYKGEWTEVNKNDLFTGLFKIDVKNDGTVNAEFVWTYLAIDSASLELLDLYKGKKGKTGIEYAEGYLNAKTNDLLLEGKSLDDPHVILGNDKYHLKLSSDNKVIYGTSDTNGTNEGLIYAVKLKGTAGEKEFLAARAKLKK
ncbi:MAG: hypothetical protein IPL84_02135 [Chitinophagaceae bacterium]|nr:hypothetical protein [Chitinophagaceae bacterium]